MSTCISRHGEYGSHELNDLHTCTLCGALDEDALLAEVERLRFGLAGAQQTIRAMTAAVDHAMRYARAAIEKRKYAEERQAAAEVELDELRAELTESKAERVQAQRRLHDALLWVPSHAQVALREQWEARERAGTPSSSVPHGRTNHGHPCCRDARLGHLPVRVAKCGGPGMCRVCGSDAAQIHGQAA